MKRWLSFLLAIPPVLLNSCGGAEPKRPVAPPASPAPVQTITAATADWPGSYEATGSVRARTTTSISSRVMGYVQQVNARVGDRVREGQVLVTVDARDLESNVRRAEAGRAEVQSAIPEADNGVAAAKANLDLAQSTFRRMQELASRKSITDQEFDEASARLKAAQATHEMARAKRAQLDSRMAQAEQEVRAASIMRDYATITSPFAGVVTARSVEPGTLANPGAPLLTIEREGAYRLEASIEESRVSSVHAGTAAEISIDALDRKLPGRVSEIVPAVDAESHSYTVKIDLPAMPQLRSGMFGRAVFALGTRRVVAVPRVAVTERGQLQSVFVVENGTARTRLVTLGQSWKDQCEVLSGLAAGEKVVAPAPPGLVDGARVEMRP